MCNFIGRCIKRFYSNHFEQAELQLSRDVFGLPELKVTRKANSLFDYYYNGFGFVDYQSHPGIKTTVAI